MIFNFFIKRRWSGWWMQYNYITSAALDCGLIVSTIVIFFALSMSNAQPPQWFGNVQVFETLDFTHQAVQKVIAEGEAPFGPDTWA